MGARYGALRVIAGVHKIAAALVAIGGFLTAFVAGAPAGLLAILLGGVIALLLWAVAESILVIIDIEENTRRAADHLLAVSRSVPSGSRPFQARPDELVIK